MITNQYRFVFLLPINNENTVWTLIGGLDMPFVDCKLFFVKYLFMFVKIVILIHTLGVT